MSVVRDQVGKVGNEGSGDAKRMMRVQSSKTKQDLWGSMVFGLMGDMMVEPVNSVKRVQSKRKRGEETQFQNKRCKISELDHTTESEGMNQGLGLSGDSNPVFELADETGMGNGVTMDQEMVENECIAVVDSKTLDRCGGGRECCKGR